MLVTFQFSFGVLKFWGFCFCFLKRILQQDRVKGRREWESHDTIRVPPPPMSSGMLYPLRHSSITEDVVLPSRSPSLCPSSSHSPVLLYLPWEDSLHPYLSYTIFSHSFFQQSFLSTDLKIQAESSQGSFRPNDLPYLASTVTMCNPSGTNEYSCPFPLPMLQSLPGMLFPFVLPSLRRWA